MSITDEEFSVILALIVGMPTVAYFISSALMHLRIRRKFPDEWVRTVLAVRRAHGALRRPSVLFDRILGGGAGEVSGDSTCRALVWLMKAARGAFAFGLLAGIAIDLLR